MLPPGRVEMEVETEAAFEEPRVGDGEPPEFEAGLFVPEPTIGEEDALGLWPA